MKHPGEHNLALLAGGETGVVRRFLLERHVRNCEACQETIEEFQALRGHLADAELPDLNWNFLSREMSANIRLGLEAGACVRTVPASRNWSPRFTVAFASLVLVAGASFFLSDRLHPAQQGTPVAEVATVLEPTGSGIEARKGDESFAFPGRPGAHTDQMVSAQGAIENRDIDGDTGSVTITNVYLQQ